MCRKPGSGAGGAYSKSPLSYNLSVQGSGQVIDLQCTVSCCAGNPEVIQAVLIRSHPLVTLHRREDHGAEGSGKGLVLEVAQSSSQGCNWDCTTNCRMMDKCLFGAILGFGNGDGSTIRPEEGTGVSVVIDDCPPKTQSDIALLGRDCSFGQGLDGEVYSPMRRR